MRIVRGSNAGPPRQDDGGGEGAAAPDVATTLPAPAHRSGNRRTTALLRPPPRARPHPTAMKTRRGEFTQLASAYPPPAASSPQGVERHAEGREGRAPAANDTAEAGRLYTILYRDVAATARAVTLRDVDNGLRRSASPSPRTRATRPGSTSCSGAARPRRAPRRSSTRRASSGWGFRRPPSKAGTPRIADPPVQQHVQGRQGPTRCACCATRCSTPATTSRRSNSLKGGKAAPKTEVDKALVSEIKQDGSCEHRAARLRRGVHDRLPPDGSPAGPEGTRCSSTCSARSTRARSTPGSHANENVRDEALGRLHEYYCYPAPRCRPRGVRRLGDTHSRLRPPRTPRRPVGPRRRTRSATRTACSPTSWRACGR